MKANQSKSQQEQSTTLPTSEEIEASRSFAANHLSNFQPPIISSFNVIIATSEADIIIKMCEKEMNIINNKITKIKNDDPTSEIIDILITHVRQCENIKNKLINTKLCFNNVSIPRGMSAAFAYPNTSQMPGLAGEDPFIRNNLYNHSFNPITGKARF